MSKTLMCDPALLTKDLAGRTYIITGANSGIGLGNHGAVWLRQGAHVVAACRRVSAAEEAIEELAASERRIGRSRQLDLGNLASVRQFAEWFKGKHSRLDGLVNNAGIMAVKEGKTTDGFERQLGVNHLGHFLLTELLLDVLKSSAPSRIVNVSSAYHVEAQGRKAEIHLDDLHFERRKYDPWAAYGQSKLANVLHAKELGKRLDGSGVTALSVHPGWVRTNLISPVMPAWVQNVVMRPFSNFIGLISIDEGAQTTLHCLLDDEVVNNNGGYYSQKGVYPNKEDRKGGWPMRSPNEQAHDDALAVAFFEKSQALVGV